MRCDNHIDAVFKERCILKYLQIQFDDVLEMLHRGWKERAWAQVLPGCHKLIIVETGLMNPCACLKIALIKVRVFLKTPSFRFSGNVVPRALMPSEEGRPLLHTRRPHSLSTHVCFSINQDGRHNRAKSWCRDRKYSSFSCLSSWTRPLEGFSLLMVCFAEQINVCSQGPSLWRLHHLGWQAALSAPRNGGQAGCSRVGRPSREAQNL